MKKALLGLALLGAAGAAYAMRSRSAGQIEPAPSSIPDFSDFDLPTWQLPDFGETNEDSNMNAPQAQANQAAFLKTIMKSEGTNKAGRDPYATVYAYAFTIKDFSDHPGNLGWKGVKLSDQMCSLAGFGPGCVSTAAGAYQITKTTWNRLKKKIFLPDFSQASQDRAALELIKERGALNDVGAGRFAAAIDKCKKEWASLPGAGYGQGENSLASLQSTFVNAGGVLA